MNIINNVRTERLVELVYGNENGAPMDVEFKSDLVKCFVLCGQVYEEFKDKSLEFNLAVMSERIGQMTQREFCESHDIAVHYFIALSKDADIKYDAVAQTLVGKLNLQDAESKAVRMPHTDFAYYYHLRTYCIYSKRDLNIAFYLDECDADSDTWHDDFVAQMTDVLEQQRQKILTTRHPDCEAKGCQYVYEHGAEGSCSGRCYWVNLV
ncbi:hypothetical protein [Acinetobacter phage pB23]|nr:hypothetical protein [Acinetobacter phage pB23]